MSQSVKHECKVEGGKLPQWVRNALAGALERFDGQYVTITITAKQKPRSLKQNSFYQGPFIEAFRQCLLQCGQRVSPEDIHAGLRNAYAKNSFTIQLPDGQPFTVPASTTRLGTIGFEEYLEEIRRDFASRFGWQLPFPNEGRE